ncbi:MAG: prepilin-type N-terminal cleavage/methylation domain-containing protein [Acidiferrobacterales bacterium]
MKKQTGFTLIELVMVIVILGILAAVALPKFVNLGGDARTSVIQGVEGSMRGANAEIYAVAAQASGGLGATSTVTIDGATVNTAYGYAATVTDLKNVMDLSPSGDFTIVTTGAGEIEMTNATIPASCSVTYTAATATSTPGYATATGGC